MFLLKNQYASCCIICGNILVNLSAVTFAIALNQVKFVLLLFVTKLITLLFVYNDLIYMYIKVQNLTFLKLLHFTSLKAFCTL